MDDRPPISKYGEKWENFRTNPRKSLPEDWRFTVVIFAATLVITPTLLIFIFSPAGQAVIEWLRG